MDLKTAILFAQEKFKTHGLTSASLDAEVLLLAAINRHRRKQRDKSWLYLNFGRYALEEEEEKSFRAFVRRRLRHEPVAYITGKKEFYGREFSVDSSVLIPRAETELLVDNSLRIIAEAKHKIALLDIGTGSGCVALSILAANAAAGHAGRIRAAFLNDISAAALTVARANAKRLGLLARVEFLEGDLVDALEKLKAYPDVLVTANLPYVTEENYARLLPSVKDFEPKLALTASTRGLSLIYRLLDNFAPLSQDFTSFALLLEADPRQMQAIEKRAKKMIPGIETEIFRDLRGKKRAIRIAHK